MTFKKARIQSMPTLKKRFLALKKLRKLNKVRVHICRYFQPVSWGFFVTHHFYWLVMHLTNYILKWLTGTGKNKPNGPRKCSGGHNRGKSTPSPLGGHFLAVKFSSFFALAAVTLVSFGFFVYIAYAN